MKKRNLNSLVLNKKSISNLKTALKGGVYYELSYSECKLEWWWYEMPLEDAVDTDAEPVTLSDYGLC
ncbi:hypothetical protein KORDIASMS9_01611 [Kordia sp. SMS9]|uniref:Uncharacterized protein n=1 Tax=Kordia aestuariivivens TaxID=2759037 RepID=A0ABR7QG41_9FLAO|nr:MULTISPECIES: hypothetical protein [Kordia]AXG69390.1 hypothetical protein KORDIASMS9_01611 [Kordia sp. SMS9]MBC8757544.1 hypothetical protein [Kordia aestuariivivens]